MQQFQAQRSRAISNESFQQLLLDKCLCLCVALRESAIRQGDATTAARLFDAITRLQSGQAGQ